ncbi:EamA family transporter [Rufibacter sediminis]|uniref:EamA family transporter n=1 Tax=Rufibacter sediminis TaxID=2762756 RepID=A0ABR6VU40_9BACT|nr:EamA family transporter [Rufibacter sediminis]MBC3540721.1 EamA family transporter [Rufibacter sediminis]
MIFLAVLLRILSNPVANVFQKQLAAAGSHPLIINFMAYFLLSIVCGVPAVWVDWWALPVEFWLYSGVVGVLGALGNGFLVRALQAGDLSVLGPINAYKSVIGLLAGMVLLQEFPTHWGVAGMGLIVGGSYFVLDTTDEKFSWRLLKQPGIQFRIWAMVLAAIEAVFIKNTILYSSPMISFISWCWFGAFFSAFITFAYPVNRQFFRNEFKSAKLWKYLFLVLCIGLMQFTTNYTFEHLPVGYALALFQLSTLVSIGLGYRFFQETNILKKLLGAVIMLAGSVMIILLK